MSPSAGVAGSTGRRHGQKPEVSRGVCGLRASRRVAARQRHRTSRRPRHCRGDGSRGPFKPIMTNRENVRQLFYSAHEAAEPVPIGWTGSVATCNPGTVSADYLEATRAPDQLLPRHGRRPVGHHVHRRQQHQGPGGGADESVNYRRMVSATTRRTTWACWTPAGHDGAATSNLAWATPGPDAIDAAHVRRTARSAIAANMLDPAISDDGLREVSRAIGRTGGRGAARAHAPGRPTADCPRHLRRLAAEGVRPVPGRVPALVVRTCRTPTSARRR